MVIHGVFNKFELTSSFSLKSSKVSKHPMLFFRSDSSSCSCILARLSSTTCKLEKTCCLPFMNLVNIHMQIRPQKHTQTPRPTLNGIWFSDILFDLEELYDWCGNLPRLTGGIDGFKLLNKQTTYWRAIIYYPGVSISGYEKLYKERSWICDVALYI